MRFMSSRLLRRWFGTPRQVSGRRPVSSFASRQDDFRIQVQSRVVNSLKVRPTATRIAWVRFVDDRYGAVFTPRLNAYCQLIS